MNATDSYAEAPAYRPFSAMAIVAFVLALLCGIPALLLLWWMEIPAALLGAIAWGGTGPAGKRGRGLAIAATIIAVLAGVYSYATQRAAITMIETSLEPLVAGLAAGDEAELTKWATEEEPKPNVQPWAQRMAAAKEALGAFRGKVEFGNVIWGPYPAFMAMPDHGDEFEPKGEGEFRRFEAVWFKAVFEKGDAWIAMRIVKSGAPPGEGGRAVGEALQKKSWHFAHDVRIFKDVGGAK